MAKTAKARRIAVLGGAGGIGRALVTYLQDRGDEVVVLDLASSLARHAVRVPTIPLDIRDEGSVASAFRELAGHWERMDGFVNLAGYNSELQPIAQTSADYFDDVVDGNLRGVFLAAKAALPLMADGGAVVHVASGLAANIRSGYGSYAASKAAVIALTKTFAVENAPQVRFNVVAPGLVDTAFLRGGTGRSDEDGKSLVPLDAYRAMTPMKRLALPEDIVGPIDFLLSPASGFMTGQVLWVNGGGYMP